MWENWRILYKWLHSRLLWLPVPTERYLKTWIFYASDVFYLCNLTVTKSNRQDRKNSGKIGTFYNYIHDRSLASLDTGTFINIVAESNQILGSNHSIIIWNASLTCIIFSNEITGSIKLDFVWVIMLVVVILYTFSI